MCVYSRFLSFWNFFKTVFLNKHPLENCYNTNVYHSYFLDPDPPNHLVLPVKGEEMMISYWATIYNWTRCHTYSLYCTLGSSHLSQLRAGIFNNRILSVSTTQILTFKYSNIIATICLNLPWSPSHSKQIMLCFLI